MCVGVRVFLFLQMLFSEQVLLVQSYMCVFFFFFFFLGVLVSHAVY